MIALTSCIPYKRIFRSAFTYIYCIYLRWEISNPNRTFLNFSKWLRTWILPTTTSHSCPTAFLPLSISTGPAVVGPSIVFSRNFWLPLKQLTRPPSKIASTRIFIKNRSEKKLTSFSGHLWFNFYSNFNIWLIYYLYWCTIFDSILLRWV